MTEDETIRRLKQTPFVIVAEEWLALSVKEPLHDQLKVLNNILEKHNWTREEFNKFWIPYVTKALGND